MNKTFVSHARQLGAALICAGASGASLAATPVFFGPSPYLSPADVPLGFYGSGSPTLLETLEDGSLHASLQGSKGGSVITSSFGVLRDSVDSDDGAINGTCGPQTTGRCASWFNEFTLAPHGGGVASASFSFVGEGTLPTAFGLVLTRGNSYDVLISFSATGREGQSLGTVSFDSNPSNATQGTTADDRFFGVQFADGIRSIQISLDVFPTFAGAPTTEAQLVGNGFGLQVDHIQYGQMAAVPEPGSWALMALGLAGLGAWTRRKATRV